MPYRKKAAAPVAIDLGKEFAAAIVGTEASWLGDYVPFIGFDIVDVATMCNSGPPAAVAWQLADFTPSVTNVFGIVAKIKQAALAEVFPTFCEGYADPTTNNVVEHLYGASMSYPTGSVPAGTVAAVTLTIDSIDGPDTMRFDFQPALDASGNTAQVDAYFRADSATAGWSQRRTDWPVNCRGWDMALMTKSGGHFTLTWEMSQPAPPVPTRPAEPAPSNLVAPTASGATDIPTLSRQLDTLQTLVRLVNRQVQDLLARSGEGAVLVPTASRAVTGGATDFNIPLSVGILITLANRPPYLGSEPDQPTRYFQVGRVALGTADGWYQSTPLEHDLTVLMPLPPGVTHVGIFLEDGMTAVVTPLAPPLGTL
jgi:hypothetical protein